MTPSMLRKFFAIRQFSFVNEKRLQQQVADELTALGVRFEREVEIAPGDIIDFMFGRIGMEVKIKGQRRRIYDQCVRYCKTDRVDEIVLATNATMGLPRLIEGKPASVIHIGRAWA